MERLTRRLKREELGSNLHTFFLNRAASYGEHQVEENEREEILLPLCFDVIDIKAN